MFETSRASQKRWREVGFAGMAGGDHVALVLVPHQDIAQHAEQGATLMNHRHHRREERTNCPESGGAQVRILEVT
jgi:hypothetical protein